MTRVDMFTGGTLHTANMFVPKFIYENVPYYWIVLGVLLIAFGMFYGKAGNQEFFIVGVAGGAFACVWGVIVFGRRLAQESRKPCATHDEYLDQTMELNLRELPPTSRPTPAEPPTPEQ